MFYLVHFVFDEAARIWDLRGTVFMSEILKLLIKNCPFYLLDKRTDGWLLTDSPLTPTLICLAYVYAVQILGPKLMENQAAYRLRGLLVIYNVFQISFNGWMFYHLCRLTWFNGYSLICQPVDYSDSENALQIITIGYCNYLCKLIDFFDTLFFVLRKKNSQQITFLHVYHHATMPLTVWIVFRFVPGGHSVFMPTVNSFVHVVMYFYYLVAAMGPRFQKYLWWKKYLTGFQMLQFLCVGVHGSQLLFIECDFPIFFPWFFVAQSIVFFLLFKGFHSKAYKVTRMDKKKN